LAQPYGVIFEKSARDTEGKPPGSLSSYDSVVLFHQYWRTYDRSLFGNVRDALEKTVTRDPDYAEAFACLSRIYSNWLRFLQDAPPTAFDPRARALSLAQRAVELGPRSSHSYHSLGLALWFNGDVDQSLVALRTGLGLNPNDTEIMADLGLRQALMMRWDQAEQLLQESYARNPGQPGHYRVGLALRHYMQGQHEAALEEMRKARPMHVLPCFVLVAAAAAQLDRNGEADGAVKEILAIAPDYGDRVIADLHARNVHPKIISALLDGLRKAPLPGRDTGLPAELPALAPPRKASGGA
jgi:adenylate cyclase